MADDPPRNGALLTWLLGIVGSLVVAGIVALMMASGNVQSRLVDLEVTIRENKRERERQVTSIEERLKRVEEDVRELQGRDPRRPAR